jgi:hypothetical protein
MPNRVQLLPASSGQPIVNPHQLCKRKRQIYNRMPHVPTIWKYVLIIAISVAATGVYSCGHMNENEGDADRAHQSNIASGPREETFNQRYNLNISLPMPEKKFLDLLDHLKLSYEPTSEVLVPLHSRNFDLSKIKRSYQIYGDTGRIGKKYRAYVDREDRVVYIENAFTYPIP